MILSRYSFDNCPDLKIILFRNETRTLSQNPLAKGSFSVGSFAEKDLIPGIESL